MMRHIPRYLWPLAVSMVMFVYIGTAHAGSYMAYGDFTGCGSEYQGRASGQDGPFDTQEACQAAIDQAKEANNMACAVYTCKPEGGDSSEGSGSGSNLIQESTKNTVRGLMNGNSDQATVGMAGLLLGAMMQDAQSGQAEQARRQAEEAAQAAAQRRAAEAQARRDEQTKQRLLGESGVGGDQGLALMGVDQTSNLTLMTGDQALAPMTTSVNQAAPKTPTSGKKKVKHSDAFNKGYYDGSQCHPETTQDACASNLPAQESLTCHDDYIAGFEVGTKEEELKIGKATRLGQLDAKNGRSNNGFTATNDTGDCRDELNMAYNNGYGQVTRAAEVKGKR